MDITKKTIKTKDQTEALANQDRRSFLKKLGLGVLALGVGGAVLSSKDTLEQLVSDKQKKKQTTGFGSGPYGV